MHGTGHKEKLREKEIISIYEGDFKYGKANGVGKNIKIKENVEYYGYI
jgi:hypothetical protein